MLSRTTEKELYEKIYNNYQAAQFIKTIRYDEQDFWAQFIMGILQEKYENEGYSKEQIRAALREGSKGSWKVTKDGVVSGDTHQFTAEQKGTLSKKQSVSVASAEENYYPNVFGTHTGSDRADELVGILFFSDNKEGNSHILPSIIMKYDGGTFERPYHHHDMETAKAYLDQKQTEGVHQNSVASLIASSSDPSEHNEILARIGWVIDDPTCQVGIFSDNIKSRLIGQLRATDLKINTEQSFIPISFYIPNRTPPEKPISPYYLENQKEDLLQALQSKDEGIQAIAYIINILNNEMPVIPFKEISPSLQDNIWSLLLHPNKLTNPTKIKFLKEFLSQNQNIDFSNPVNQELLNNILHIAAASGETTIIERYLSKIDEDTKEKLQCIAVKNGRINVVKLFLDENIDVNVIDPQNNTLLMIAAQYGHAEIVELLLNNGAIPDMDREDSTNALMIASQYGHAATVKVLLDGNATATLLNEGGDNPLNIAAIYGHKRVVEILLEHFTTEDHEKALILAIQHKQYAVVKLMLEKNVNPNAKDEDNNNALSIAIQYGLTDIVKALLDKGADPNIVNQDGDYPLHVAIENFQNVTIAQLLINKNANYNLKDQLNRTPLDLAKEYSNNELIKLLGPGKSPRIRKKIKRLKINKDPATSNLEDTRKIKPTTKNTELLDELMELLNSSPNIKFSKQMKTSDKKKKKKSSQPPITKLYDSHLNSSKIFAKKDDAKPTKEPGQTPTK